MPGLSRYAHRELLDHLLRTGAYTQPTHIYVALFTVSPTSVGGGTEVTGGSYARVLFDTWNAATDADPAVATNNGEILFTQATANWGAVVAAALFDASTGGNMLAWGTVSRTVNSGDQARFTSGSLAVQLNVTA